MSIAHNTVNFSKNLKARFTNKQISTNVTYTYVQDFKDIIGFRDLLSKNLETYESLKARNSKYSISETLDFMVDAVFQGYTRFSHLEKLRNDTAYTAIHGGAAPSEKICRDTLKNLPPEASDVLRGINRELLRLQAAYEGPREVAADFDDSVTVFGSQERSNIGYNPKYHGRPSYKEKVGVISGSKELVDLTLEEGSHHSNYEFLDFFKRFETSLRNGISSVYGQTVVSLTTRTSLILKTRAMSMLSKQRTPRTSGRSLTGYAVIRRTTNGYRPMNAKASALFSTQPT